MTIQWNSSSKLHLGLIYKSLSHGLPKYRKYTWMYQCEMTVYIQFFSDHLVLKIKVLFYFKKDDFFCVYMNVILVLFYYLGK